MSNIFMETWMKNQMKSRLICKVRSVVSPIHKEDQGLQFLGAIPNTAGRTFSGQECPSFQHPYLVYHGLVVQETFDEDVQRHIKILKDMGYTCSF